MKTLSSADTAAPGDTETDRVEVDQRRDALVAALRAELGASVVDSLVRPGDDIWVRVTADSWAEAARVARHHLGFRYFNFLSVIDWMPSPFGREMDSEVDTAISGTTGKEPEPMRWGVTGGATRFQVFARVNNVVEHLGITFKADIPEPGLVVPTWIPVYAGANWHEREAYEMYGISFVGHPDLRNLYLPTEFEGHPLRKDFPLLARRVKPWPGIVDVEPMPGDTGADEEPTEGGAE